MGLVTFGAKQLERAVEASTLFAPHHVASTIPLADCPAVWCAKCHHLLHAVLEVLALVKAL